MDGLTQDNTNKNTSKISQEGLASGISLTFCNYESIKE